MDQRQINYSRRKFKTWKNKVVDHLPYFVTEFYKIKEYIDYDTHKMLGRVIMNINDPAYSILDNNGKRLDRNNEIAMEILLELDVNKIFSFIAKSKHKYHKQNTIPMSPDFIYGKTIAILKEDGTTEPLNVRRNEAK